MITDVGEIRAIRTMLDELRREEGISNHRHWTMIETPASAVMAIALPARPISFRLEPTI